MRSATETETWSVDSLGDCTIQFPTKSSSLSKAGANEFVFKSSDPNETVLLEKACARDKIFWNVDENFVVGIITCGGLCPGLNSVIRALVLTLWWSYGVRKIKGFRFGFQGLNSEIGKWKDLDPDVVSNIHHFGGSLIGTSRGPQEVDDMITTLQREKVSILFTIGGDGTLKGAKALSERILEKKLDISVIGIPKTIDNDIPLMEKTFGFNTAVERAVTAIESGHCEAWSHERGVAIVKLMGRDSGFIAVEASIASGEVNLCLIPEHCFDLDNVTDYVKNRLQARNHCLIVVAEGAGQHCFGALDEVDVSGNKRFVDVGVELKKHLQKSIPDITLKYIDPSYMIRSAKANPVDEEFCVMLSQMAVHSAMRGKTNMSIAYIGGTFVNLPLSKLQGRKHVDLDSDMYKALLSNNGQKAAASATKVMNEK